MTVATRVVIAEDEMLLREGLARLLAEAGVEVLATASEPADAWRKVIEHRPDVLITDIRMPPGHGDEGIRLAEQLAAEQVGVGILVLSQHLESAYAVRLLEHRGTGVGYLLKNRVGDLEMLTGALRRVAEGRTVIDPRVVSALVNRKRAQDPLGELTAREREILSLLAEGQSNRAIAATLVLSPKTVDSHIHAVFMKLGLQATGDENRRVLAVLHYLRAVGGAASG